MGTPAISAGPDWGTCTCSTGFSASVGVSSRASPWGWSHNWCNASAARCSKLSHG
jgi:hypothetical protein